MDIRQIPGSITQATLLPSQALREMNTFAQNEANAIVQAVAVSPSATRFTTPSVTQQGSPNMTVNIAPFIGFSAAIHGIGFNGNITGQTGVAFTGDGMTATATATIAAASSSNPRRDLIVCQLAQLDMNLADNNLDTISLNAINTVTQTVATPTTFLPDTIQRVALQYVQGAAGPSPSLPAVPAGWIPLVEIYVGTSVTSIVNANIFEALPYANRCFSLEANAPAIDQLLPYTTGSGLTLNVTGGSVLIGNNTFAVSAGTLTLTNAITNYVYVNSSGTLVFNTTGFVSASVPIAQVVCSGGNITSINDVRGRLQAINTVSSLQGITAKAPIYVNNSTVTLQAGVYSDGLTNLSINTDVIITTSGVNGLDTGIVATNTWYDLYVITDSSSGHVAGIFSTSHVGPVLPAGYDSSFNTRTAWRTDGSGLLIPLKIMGGWPFMPYISYDTPDNTLLAAAPGFVVQNGNSTSPVALSLTSFIPTTSLSAALYISTINSGGGYGVASLGKDSSHFYTVGQSSNGGGDGVNISTMERTSAVNTSQQLYYQVTASNILLTVYVLGFTVTEL